MNKKVIIQLFGILSYALTQWLLLIFLTRIYSVDVTAQYIYYLAFFTPLSIFFAYGLRNGIASDKANDFSFRTYLTVSNLGVLFYSLSGFILFYFIDNLNVSLFVFTLLLKLNEMVSEPYYGRFLRNNTAENYAYSKIYKFFFGAIFFIIGWGLENFFEIPYLGLYGYIISIFYIFVYFDKPNKDRSIEIDKSKIMINSESLTALLISNLPLAISSFVVALSSSVPKVVFGFEEQGLGLTIFGILIYFNTIAILPITATTQILFGKSKIKGVSSLYKLVAIYSLCFFVSYIYLIPYILDYIYSITTGYNLKNLIYASIFGVIQIFVTLNNFYILYNRRFRLVLYIAIVSAASNIALSILLVKFGLDGILLSVLFSGCVTLIVSSFLARKVFHSV